MTGNKSASVFVPLATPDVVIFFTLLSLPQLQANYVDSVIAKRSLGYWDHNVKEKQKRVKGAEGKIT